MPSIINASSTLGLISSADTSGVLQLQTANTAAVTIDASQNVGVGTASPAYKLSVSGTNNTVGLGIVGTAASGDSGIYYNVPAITGSYNIINAVPSASTGVGATFGNGNSTSGNAFTRLDLLTTGANGGDPKLTYTISGVLNWCVGVDNSDSDKFKISGSDTPGTSDYLTIDTSGNVGIGTTSPSNRVSIVTASGSDGIVSVKSPTTDTAGVVIDGGTSTNKGSVLKFSKNASVLWQMGTDSAIIGGTTDNFHLYGGGANAILFSTNATERARIDSSGNMIVGQSSATINSYYTATLGSVSTTTTKTAFAVGATSGSYTGQVVQTSSISTGSTSWAHFYGAYGNGTSITTDAYYIYGNGNMTNKNGSYGTISDVKLKENIVDATPKLADVMRLQVRNFNFKTEPDQKQIGFIAQEFENIFPTMIDISPDRDAEGNANGNVTKSIKTSVLIPVLVKAIQEQQAIIQQLQADVAALKG